MVDVCSMVEGDNGPERSAARKGIDPKQVLVMRHQPQETELNRLLPLLASEHPNLFNAFQRSQRPQTEKAMLRAKYLASFIARDRKWGRSKFSCCLSRAALGGPPLRQRRDAAAERLGDLPFEAVAAERAAAIRGGAQALDESRIERRTEQRALLPLPLGRGATERGNWGQNKFKSAAGSTTKINSDPNYHF